MKRGRAKRGGGVECDAGGPGSVAGEDAVDHDLLAGGSGGEEEGEGEEITLGETAGLKVVGGHRGRSVEGAAGIAVNALDGAPRGDQAGYQDQAPASEGEAGPLRARERLIIEQRVGDPLSIEPATQCKVHGDGGHDPPEVGIRGRRATAEDPAEVVLDVRHTRERKALVVGQADDVLRGSHPGPEDGSWRNWRQEWWKVLLPQAFPRP